MASEFLMPKLGLTMEEGTIAEWLVADGDPVTAGAAVLRIETDKTETEVDASESGRLHVTGEVGDTFACGERIGWFLADGEDAPSAATPPTASAAAAPADATAAAPASAPVAHAVSPASTGRVLASPLAKRLATERSVDLRTVRGTGPGGRIVAADIDGAPTKVTGSAQVTALAPAQSGLRVPATTAARQLADLVGVDLDSVAVDPTDGRVTKDAVARHVRNLLTSSVQPAVTSPPPPPPPGAIAATLPAAMQDPARVIKLSGVRGTIAKRMHGSLTDMAQLTLHLDADLDAVVADRTARKAAGAAPSYTDYVIAAAARALVIHPLVNSQIIDAGVALLPTVHIGMAVALDEGLIVPVIPDTATRSLNSLSTESSRLATAARGGALTLPELEGGTFSVSTLGMFGVDGFTPVINPPNTAILGVGRLRDDLVLDEAGNVTSTTRLTLSLTWDHRAFDGAPAAAFCKTIADLLGDPSALDAPAA